MGVRKLQSLIEGLPSDSALARDINPNTAGSDWGVAEELLALAVEVLDVGNRQFVIVNSKKGSPAPKPIKIPRPWDRKEKRKATLAEVKELMRDVPVIPGGKGGGE